MPLLLDTGAIYALADRDDPWHDPVREFLSAKRETLLTPCTVAPEAAYLVRTRLGAHAEEKLTESFATGEVTLEHLTQADLSRCVELQARYNFLGLVDASMVAIAERLKLKALVTTDRRDFRRVRPKHIAAFELLP